MYLEKESVNEVSQFFHRYVYCVHCTYAAVHDLLLFIYLQLYVLYQAPEASAIEISKPK